MSKRVIKAFLECKTYKNRHDDTSNGYLYYRNNCIAKKASHSDEIWVTTCGWNTRTTKSRLNQLPGVSVRHIQKQLYLNNKPWDGEWVSIEDWNKQEIKRTSLFN